jgi:hypothetical protein
VVISLFLLPYHRLHVHHLLRPHLDDLLLDHLPVDDWECRMTFRFEDYGLLLAHPLGSVQPIRQPRRLFDARRCIGDWVCRGR